MEGKISNICIFMSYLFNFTRIWKSNRSIRKSYEGVSWVACGNLKGYNSRSFKVVHLKKQGRRERGLKLFLSMCCKYWNKIQSLQLNTTKYTPWNCFRFSKYWKTQYLSVYQQNYCDMASWLSGHMAAVWQARLHPQQATASLPLPQFKTLTPAKAQICMMQKPKTFETPTWWAAVASRRTCCAGACWWSPTAAQVLASTAWWGAAGRADQGPCVCSTSHQSHTFNNTPVMRPSLSSTVSTLQRKNKTKQANTG